jgi:M6 family metalloprotease-like protein
VVVAVVGTSIATVAAPAAAEDEKPYPDTPHQAYYTTPIRVLSATGIFVGTECDSGFCPNEPVDRATMAVWLVRILDGADPEAVVSTRFVDVDGSHPHAAFIERLADLGITAGCKDGTVFCPDRPVSRAHMAAFLSCAYGLPEATDHRFDDVPPRSWYAPYVASLVVSGITEGCGGAAAYCPHQATTRGQMATFLHRAEIRNSCMPAGGLERVHTGFPLSESAAPSSGQVRMAVIFMDFPDAPATFTTNEEVEYGLPYMERYLEAQSYGQLDLDIDVFHRWLRTPDSYRSHTSPDAAGASGLWPSAAAEAVRLADDAYDFSETAIVMTIFPSAHFGRGLALGDAAADGRALSTFRINTHPGTGPESPSNWGLIAAHELAHNFGLADYYPYDESAHEGTVGDTWVYVEFGLMGLRARFTSASDLWFATPVEMLAWSRWQLGWLRYSQVKCGIEDGETVIIQPVAHPGDGTVMVAVPLTPYELIVIENRRRLGFDATTPSTSPSGTPPLHGLLEEGVLVYTVDTRLGTGLTPIKVAGDSGNGRVERFPVLGLGESVTVRGHSVTVTGDDGSVFAIVISGPD